MNPKDEVIDDKSGEHYQRIGYINRPKSDSNAKVVELPSSRYKTPQPPQLPPRNLRSEDAKSEALERRQDMLFGVVLLFVVSGLCGIDPALRGLLVLTGLSGALIGCYVALRVYANALLRDKSVGGPQLHREMPEPRREELQPLSRIPRSERVFIQQTDEFGMPGYWEDTFDPGQVRRAQ